MIVKMCKVGLTRLGADAQETLFDALRERDCSPVAKDCMDRCKVCETGSLVATVDGMPVAARDGAELLTQVEALAES